MFTLLKNKSFSFALSTFGSRTIFGSVNSSRKAVSLPQVINLLNTQTANLRNNVEIPLGLLLQLAQNLPKVSKAHPLNHYHGDVGLIRAPDGTFWWFKFGFLTHNPPNSPKKSMNMSYSLIPKEDHI